jgi:large subunit ribosomal protein L10
MDRNQKQNKVRTVLGYYDGSAFAILVDFSGVNTKMMDEFKERVRERGGSLLVVKNTLARVALKQRSVDGYTGVFHGPTMLVYGKEEISPLAKAVKEFQKATKGLMPVKAVFFDGAVYPAGKFDAFTSMPTKKEIQSKLVGILQAPLTQLIRTLRAPQVSLINALRAREEKIAG